MYSAVVDERRMQEIEGPAMKGAVSYTSNVIMSMSAAATLAGVDCLQVPTSSTLIDSEDCYDVASSNATMPEIEAEIEIEIEAQQYFKDGVKRSGTDMALHLCGAECPRIVLSHFTDIEVPELGVKLPTCGLRVERLHKQLWCKFLSLEEAAKLEELDDKERSQWLAFGKYFDYARYRAESAPLVKVFGTLVSSSGDKVVVRWLNGVEEDLHGNLAEQVSVLEDNSIRNFMALARFVGHRLSYIEDVRPDRDAATVDNDLSWMTECQNG